MRGGRGFKSLKVHQQELANSGFFVLKNIEGFEQGGRWET